MSEIKNCPFCSARVKNSTFTESENFRAIYNIAPILPGHSLIVPKQHITSLLDLNEAELCELMVFGRDIVTILLQAFNVKAFNWTIQEGEEAGQTISHLHLHLIPRKPNDFPQPGDWYPKLLKREAEMIDSESRPQLTPEEMKNMVSHIRSFMKAD